MNLAISVIFSAENLSYQAMKPMCYCLRNCSFAFLFASNWLLYYKSTIIHFSGSDFWYHLTLNSLSSSLCSGWSISLSLIYYRKEKCFSALHDFYILSRLFVFYFLFLFYFVLQPTWLGWNLDWVRSVKVLPILLLVP